MELLNASLLKVAVSTRSTATKVMEISTVVVDLPRTKVLFEVTSTIKHSNLHDE
jgi:hypothetical protein